MKNTYKLIWSDEALNNLRAIIDYLEYRWTNKEIKKFSQLLVHQLYLIEQNPFLYPLSDRSNGLRKSVLSRQTTIYYQIIGNEIHIITLFDNRQNPNKIS
nr:type II toxin-antitoxin system RelE/ParE family toxin [Bacteroidota bacterium]